MRKRDMTSLIIREHAFEGSKTDAVLFCTFVVCPMQCYALDDWTEYKTRA